MIRHAHQPYRLTVALGPRHAEIVLEPAVGIGTLFMADDADRLAAEAAEAADNGRVLAVLAVAGERHEVGDQRRDIVEAMRPQRMPRHLRLLPRRQRGIELLEGDRGLALDTADLFADRLAVRAQRPQFVGLGLQLGHRLFEIEIRTHRSDQPIMLKESGARTRPRAG